MKRVFLPILALFLFLWGLSKAVEPATSPDVSTALSATAGVVVTETQGMSSTLSTIEVMGIFSPAVETAFPVSQFLPLTLTVMKSTTSVDLWNWTMSHPSDLGYVLSHTTSTSTSPSSSISLTYWLSDTIPTNVWPVITSTTYQPSPYYTAPLPLSNTTSTYVSSWTYIFDFASISNWMRPAIAASGTIYVDTGNLIIGGETRIHTTAYLQIGGTGLGTLELSFNPSIIEGDTSLVQLQITSDQNAPSIVGPLLSKRSVTDALTYSSPITLYERMQAQLSGPNADITADAYPEKSIAKDRPAAWLWSVSPHTAGNHSFFISLSIPAQIGNITGTIDIDPLQFLPIEIEVKPRAPTELVNNAPPPDYTIPVALIGGIVAIVVAAIGAFATVKAARSKEVAKNSKQAADSTLTESSTAQPKMLSTPEESKDSEDSPSPSPAVKKQGKRPKSLPK